MMRARLLANRVLKRFRRDRDGATAVEFALISVPFFGLLFAIIETGLVFFTGQVMESAATASGRLIMTGQIAKIADNTQKVNTFKTAFCANISWFMKCSDIYYDVQAYTTFSGADLSMPIKNGAFDSTNLPRFSPGTTGQIVVVRAYYPRKIYLDYMSLMGGSNGALTGNVRLLVATSVFKNEPF